MNNFLQILLEGDFTSLDTADIVNEKIEQELNENTLPIGLLIESVYVDNATAINAAMETYQMACIIGGATIVREGEDCDKQEKAAEILTESAGDFFKKIIERLKKIRDWFIGIVKKIIDKFKKTGSNVEAKYKKTKTEFDKNFEDGKFEFTGIILDFDNGEKLYQTTAGALTNDKLKSFELIDEEYLNYCEENPEELDKLNELLQAISGVDDNYGENAKRVVREAYGVDKEPTTIKVTSDDVDVMKKVIESVSKSKINEALKLSTKTENTIKKLTATITKYTSTKASNPNTIKQLQMLVSAVNMVSTSAAIIINTRLDILGTAANEYIGFMQKVASGKAVAESMDFSFLFEGEELEDDTITQTEKEPIAESFIDFAYGFLN